MKFSFDSTIAAISTAPGPGAISVIRISGPESKNILQKIFSPRDLIERENLIPEVPLFKSHSAKHGYIYDPSTKDIIDEIVLVFYKNPSSFTGEDLVEISCHGGPVICHEILALLIREGATLARRGEFTERAFLNGKMDLTQAESILDIIQAKTSRQGRAAVSALTGRLGKPIKETRDELITLLTRIVAGLDFPEEIGDAPEPEIESVVKRSLFTLRQLSSTARAGKFLREGLKLAIVGRPNAGKSSLLNQLLKFERAIVTDVPGTTRDSIEEILDVNGIPVTLIDTAGIRHTEDSVEKIGIERSRQAIAECDLALLVVDLTEGWGQSEEEIKAYIDGKPFLIVANKVDIASSDVFNSDLFDSELFRGATANAGNVNDVNCNVGNVNSGGGNVNDAIVNNDAGEAHANQPIGVCKVSAMNGENVSQLTKAIEDWVYADVQLRDGPSLNVRQAALCNEAAQCLDIALDTVRVHMPQDCIAGDLKIAIDALSEISGEAVSEEIISEVFANFCIGK